jgi:hypothetical protein
LIEPANYGDASGSCKVYWVVETPGSQGTNYSDRKVIPGLKDLSALFGTVSNHGILALRCMPFRPFIRSLHQRRRAVRRESSDAAPDASANADHTIAMLDEEQHLGVPVVGAERPAMVEDNRLAVPPVLVENLDAVLGRDCTHGYASFGTVVRIGATVFKKPVAVRKASKLGSDR